MTLDGVVIGLRVILENECRRKDMCRNSFVNI